jgi:hypothetical protein
MRTYQLVLLGTLALGACNRPDRESEKVADVFAALPNLPIPPSSVLLSRAGSPDAVQLRFRSETGAAAVVDYYRGVLTQGGWSLVGDSKQDSAQVLYAERAGRPIWVRITPDQEGSVVDLSGAAPADSTKAPQP